MCTKDAIVEGWQSLTQVNLDDLVASADKVIDNEDEGQKLIFEVKEETKKFQAK